MSEPRHIIKRQILEFHVGPGVDTRWLQSEMSRIYRQRIVPLIDRYCTELSGSDRIDRITSLELDLGAVDPDHLEDDLVANVRRLLRQELAVHITSPERQSGDPGTSPKTASQLELLSLFICTGSLPWWAEASNPYVLDDSLQHLMQHAPLLLRRTLQVLAQDERPLQRLVQHIDEARLATLCSILAPALQSDFPFFPQDLVSVLQQTSLAATRQPRWLSHRVWHGIVCLTSRQAGHDVSPKAFYRDLLIRIAVALGVRYRPLIEAVHQIIQRQRKPFRSPLRETVEHLYRELAGAASPGIADRPPPAAPVVAQEGPPAGMWTRLRSLVAQLPTPMHAPVRQAIANLERQASSGHSVTSLKALLQHVGMQHRLPPAVVEHWLAALAAPIWASEPSPEALSALAGMRGNAASVQAMDLSSTAAMMPLDLGFSDADEVYIGNAGLVILWPFLSLFFAHLGLVGDNQFKDTASVQRAVGLLQYIATEEVSPPEYLLPLNKVLCGMEPAAVFDFDRPVQEAEAEACTDLLTAVIAQAPILRDMSISGFRGSFLLRQGMLSSRDGAWLLRVERETYDVVTDRFPWSFAWVKLPWMTTPLRVEW